MSIRKGRTSLAGETTTLRVGDVAPDFELPGHGGDNQVRLRDYRGAKNVMLVFYPLDWTGV